MSEGDKLLNRGGFICALLWCVSLHLPQWLIIGVVGQASLKLA